MYLHIPAFNFECATFKIDIVTKDNGEFYSLKVSDCGTLIQQKSLLPTSSLKAFKEKGHNEHSKYDKYRNNIVNIISHLSVLSRSNYGNNESFQGKAAVKICPSLLIENSFIEEVYEVWAETFECCTLCFEIDNYKLIFNPTLLQSLSESRIKRYGFELWLDNFFDNSVSHSVAEKLNFDLVTLSKAHYWDISQDFSIFDSIRNRLGVRICVKDWPEEMIDDLMLYCSASSNRGSFYVQP